MQGSFDFVQDTPASVSVIPHTKQALLSTSSLQTKKCAKCKKTKPLTDFNVDKQAFSGHQSWCRTCVSNKHRGIANIKRKIVWEYLKYHHCVGCLESNPLILEFDHLYPHTKIECISRMMTNSRYSVADLEHEISECQVLCPSCHGLKTARDRRYYKDFIDWEDPTQAEKYSKPWLTIPAGGL